jgi:hypothetical protein
MESDNRLPTGEWNGFYLERGNSKRGWMHLYMSFTDGKIKGEGTDYVGPWVANGEYDLETGACAWVKQYLQKHQVHYTGQLGENGIMGHWNIGHVVGEFHIWPRGMSNLNELYLADDLQEPAPTIQLGSGFSGLESVTV